MNGPDATQRASEECLADRRGRVQAKQLRHVLANTANLVAENVVPLCDLD